MPTNKTPKNLPLAHLSRHVPAAISINLASSTLAGFTTTVIFNPFDRVFYRALKTDTPFILADMLKTPMQAVGQTLMQRCLFGNIYYVAQGEMQARFAPLLQKDYSLSDTTTRLLVGLSAGVINGLVSNPLSAIKYYRWEDSSRTFLASVAKMWADGQGKPFMNGILPTICREVTFGGFYEVSRGKLHQELEDHIGEKKVAPPVKKIGNFICDASAAGVGTLFSGFFNYARNKQFSTPPTLPPPTIRAVFQTVKKGAKESSLTVGGKLKYCSKLFKVGLGTARSAVGMAMGQYIFDETREYFTKRTSPKNSR